MPIENIAARLFTSLGEGGIQNCDSGAEEQQQQHTDRDQESATEGIH